jgi:hypothetical protein
LSLGFNAIGLVFLLFASITFNFPSGAPVTSDSMNYTSAAIGLVAILSFITWLTTARKRFTGPSDVRNLIVDGIESSKALASGHNDSKESTASK